MEQVGVGHPASIHYRGWRLPVLPKDPLAGESPQSFSVGVVYRSVHCILNRLDLGGGANEPATRWSFAPAGRAAFVVRIGYDARASQNGQGSNHHEHELHRTQRRIQESAAHRTVREAGVGVRRHIDTYR